MWPITWRKRSQNSEMVARMPVELFSGRVCHRGGCGQKLAVPGKGAIKTGLERESWSPIKNGAGPLSAEELEPDYVARLIEHFRTQRRLHLPQDQFHHLKHTDLDLVRKIKSLAAESSVGDEALGQQ